MLCYALFKMEIFKVSNVTKWLIFRNPVTNHKLIIKNVVKCN